MKNALRPVRMQVYAVVLVCTSEQWAALQTQFPNTRPGLFRGREFLSRNWGARRVVFLRVGDGLIPAVASAQFGIDRWNPDVLMSTVATDDAVTDAIREVSELNNIRMVSEPIVASNLDDTVPIAIAASRSAELQS